MDAGAGTVATLGRLRIELPEPSAAFENPDAEQRARGALAWFVNRILESNPEAAKQNREDPATCPNCDLPVNSIRSPYCSECCGEEAGFVRQLRRFLAEETIFAEERQSNVGEKFWHVIGGGFPRRLARLPEKGWQRIFAREGGKCEVCGAIATGLDHVGSG